MDSLPRVDSKTVMQTKPVGTKSDLAIGSFNQDIKLPKSIKFTLDNTADSASAKDFFLGDAIGIVEAVHKKIGDAGAGMKVSHAIFQEYLKASPLVFSGLRLEAKQSSSQFSNELEILDADLDGSKNTTPIPLDEAVGNGQYNPLIQTFSGEISLGVRRALKITVDPSEKVIVTLYISAGVSRF